MRSMVEHRNVLENSFERFNWEIIGQDGQHLPGAFGRRFLCKLKCAQLQNDHKKVLSKTGGPDRE